MRKYLRIVFRDKPVRRAISRMESWSRKAQRRITLNNAMSITPLPPAENSQGGFKTWVNSQRKFLALTGQFSVEFNTKLRRRGDRRRRHCLDDRRGWHGIALRLHCFRMSRHERHGVGVIAAARTWYRHGCLTLKCRRRFKFRREWQALFVDVFRVARLCWTNVNDCIVRQPFKRVIAGSDVWTNVAPYRPAATFLIGGAGRNDCLARHLTASANRLKDIADLAAQFPLASLIVKGERAVV